MKIKCECGGAMKEATLKQFDFTAMAGLPVVLRNVRGLRCAKCKGQTLTGPTIERALSAVAFELLKLEGRLVAEEARFLRHRLQLTQKELAARMGIHPVTVGSWESKIEPISPQHDHILRGMVLAELIEPAGSEPRAGRMRSVLAQVRKHAPAKTPRRLVVAGVAKDRMRGSAERFVAAAASRLLERMEW